jgi:hypothetical protein
MAPRRPREWLGVAAAIQRETRDRGLIARVSDNALALYDRLVTDTALRDVTST